LLREAEVEEVSSAFTAFRFSSSSFVSLASAALIKKQKVSHAKYTHHHLK
jgi:hypothetical protein